MKLTTNQTSVLKSIWESAKQYVRENRVSIGFPITVEDEMNNIIITAYNHMLKNATKLI